MKNLEALSLGWGVQSFTIACMSALGDLPPIDVAINADTTWERQSTYSLAAKFIPWLGERGITVKTVRAARTDVVVEAWGNGVMIPAATLNIKGDRGMILRQCTHDWKIMPVRAEITSMLAKGQRCNLWMGISMEEAARRVRDSDVQYITNTYPLLDMVKMTRGDCVDWLVAHNLPVPDKSACVFCPYHSKAQWEDLKRKGGQDWDTAVAVDEQIRHIKDSDGYELFLHGKRLPLAKAIHTMEDDHASQPDMFEDDGCTSGFCFV